MFDHSCKDSAMRLIYSSTSSLLLWCRLRSTSPELINSSNICTAFFFAFSFSTTEKWNRVGFSFRHMRMCYENSLCLSGCRKYLQRGLMQALLIMPEVAFQLSAVILIFLYWQSWISFGLVMGVMPKWVRWKMSVYLSYMIFLSCFICLPWFGPKDFRSICLNTSRFTYYSSKLTGVR